MSPARKVVVIGAGLTGLSAAVNLRARGAEVTVLESSSQPGGPVRSEHDGGFLVEHGPNSMMIPDTEVADFLRSLGLETDIVEPQAKKRFLVRKGRPLALPLGPAGAFTTPLFTLAGKLRVLGEPFVSRGATDDESLASFVSRRLGPEALAYAVEPFVAGIYAGDPEKLSARWAFPKLWNLEREHGSLIRGGLRKRRGGSAPKMISFRNGMGELPQRVAEKLGSDLHCGVRVENIERSGNEWLVEWSRAGTTHRETTDAVVSTIPAFNVPDLPWPRDLASSLEFLREIVYPPVTVAALGFRRADVTHPLDGFGMLVPSAEKRRILGAIFSSSLFPGRAPRDHVLLTVFVGGERQPRLAQLGDDALEQDILSDLHDLLGVRGAPVFRRVVRWPRAIPQYNTGYGEFLDRMEKAERDWPGLHLAGNYRGGIAAGQCIQNGLRLAEQLSTPSSAS
jgi:oxygen-dependent protoporphyrinogen oxidase